MPYAPGAQNPDTRAQAEYYNPMGGLGMGAGMAISGQTFRMLDNEWYQALNALGGRTLREKLMSLPTLQNIIEMGGGMNVGGPGGAGAKAMMRTGPELEQMGQFGAMKSMDDAMKYMGQGGHEVRSSKLLNQAPR